jgi:hypothetical protein
MTYRTTKLYKRNDTETLFHVVALMCTNPEWRELCEAYDMQNRREINLINDRTIELIINWDSIEQCNEFRSHPVAIAHYETIKEYNQLNNIAESE